MREHWATIEEFPTYSISTHGRHRNDRTGNVLKPGGIANSGYAQAHFYSGESRKVRYIHRLVVMTFLCEDLKGLEVDHVDGNKLNNVVWNLDVVTPSRNSQLAYDRGARIPPRMKPVRIVETGEVFASLSVCARHLNRTIQSVWPAVQDPHRTTAGVHLEYI